MKCLFGKLTVKTKYTLKFPVHFKFYTCMRIWTTTFVFGKIHDFINLFT